MVFLNIEHIIQKSLKSQDIKNQLGIKFLLALTQQDSKQMDQSQIEESWESRLKEIDDQVESDLSKLFQTSLIWFTT